MELRERVAAILEEVRMEHAPDLRLSVFEIGVAEEKGVVRLVGSISDAAAAHELHRRVALLDPSLTVMDEVERLPHAEEADNAHALVTASVAPMLAEPIVTGTHLSQALLGHHVTVLRTRGRWLHCRAEDGYLGWIHRGYLRRVDAIAAEQWALGLSREICVSLGAELIGDDGEVAARLPWGARVVRGEDGSVELPSGVVGRVRGELVPLATLPRHFPRDGRAVVETAARWMGAPYLWGGLTAGGVDCSGLAQAVYRMHGVRLPRDSDLQAKQGAPVDPGDDFSQLRPGDLLFFAEDAGRISHVVLSTGGSRIIHSSLGNGGVYRNDLMGRLPYEEELRRLFVCARRVIPG